MKDLQLSLYALAVKEILELEPVRLVFHYLQNNQRQETTRDAKQLDEAQKVVQEAARTFARENSQRNGLCVPQLRVQADLPGARRSTEHLSAS